MAGGVAVEMVDCPGHGGERGREHSGPSVFDLCLVNRGCFRYASSRAATVIDPTVALFRLVGEESRISHPLPGGDLDLWIAFDSSVLAAVGGGDLSLPSTVPIPAEMQLQHRRLQALIRRGAACDRLQEQAVLVLSGALAAAAAHRVDCGRPRSPRVARRLVDDARIVLVNDPNLQALELARLVGCSPYHLSRLFVRYTGAGIAAYKIALRTARVLDELADGVGSISDLASAVGFADHAHLSRTIRRHFGTTPSNIREMLGENR